VVRICGARHVLVGRCITLRPNRLVPDQRFAAEVEMANMLLSGSMMVWSESVGLFLIRLEWLVNAYRTWRKHRISRMRARLLRTQSESAGAHGRLMKKEEKGTELTGKPPNG
jgi:hypothetical protein